MTRVTRPVTPDAPRCPGCFEDVLIERDPVTRRFYCCVCSRMWPVSDNLSDNLTVGRGQKTRMHAEAKV